MKHPSSRALYTTWDRSRGRERAPYRSDLAPDAIRDWLGDVLVVSYDAAEDYPLRVAGTRVCALLGQDPKGKSLTSLFALASRGNLTEIVTEVAEELLVAVIGLDAVDADGNKAALEMLLLPFRTRACTPLSLTGMIVPLTPLRMPIRALALSSWRYEGGRRATFAPRALRKLTMARGLTVYEGAR